MGERFHRRSHEHVDQAPVPERFFGEVDPVRRQQLRHKKEESRFDLSGIGSRHAIMAPSTAARSAPPEHPLSVDPSPSLRCAKALRRREDELV
jgi:hypothetical protein